MRSFAAAWAAFLAVLGACPAWSSNPPPGSWCQYRYATSDPVKRFYYRTAGPDGEQLPLDWRTELWACAISVLNRPGMGGWSCLWYEDESDLLQFGPNCGENGECAVYLGTPPPRHASAVAVAIIHDRDEADICFNSDLYQFGMNWPVTLGEWKDNYDPSFIELRYPWLHEQMHVWGAAHWKREDYEDSRFDPNYPTLMLSAEGYPRVGIGALEGNGVAPMLAAVLHCGDAQLLENRLPCTGPVATEAFHGLTADPSPEGVRVTLTVVREVNRFVLVRVGPDGTVTRELAPRWTEEAAGRLAFSFLDCGLDPGSYLYSVRLGEETSPPVGVIVPRRRPQLTVTANPGHPMVVLRLPEGCPLTASLYTAAGRRVDRLRDGWLPAGEHALPAESSLPSGLYFIRVETPDHVLTEKVTVLR